MGDEPGLLAGSRPLRPSPGAGPLVNRTVAVKDVFDVAGTVTGAGVPAWAAEAPPAASDAEAVARLCRAGATLWAKAITDEFAYSLDGDNPHFGPPRNTRAPGRLPGGSSAGPAAAVAARLVDIGIGSDTAGSIRVPASYCGLYGYRPTHGVIPTAGLVPLSPSFDTVGVLARDLDTLRDAATALGALGGSRAPMVTRFVVPAAFGAVADAAVRSRYAEVVTALRAAACDVDEWGAQAGVRPDELSTSYLALSRYEAWQSHGAWVAAHWSALSDGVAGRFRDASEVDAQSAAFAAALEHRARLKEQLAGTLEPSAVLVLPAAANEPLRVDAPAELRAHSRAAAIKLGALAGLTGAPCVVVPVAAADRLPIGVCLVGRPGQDRVAFAAARIVATLVDGR